MEDGLIVEMAEPQTPEGAVPLDPKAAATLQEQWEKDNLDLLPTKNSNDNLKEELGKFEASQKRSVIDRIRGLLGPKPEPKHTTSQPTSGVTSEASRTVGFRGDGSPRTTMPTAEKPSTPPIAPPTGTPNQ